MNRRGFFQAIAGAIAGPRLAKFLPPRLRREEPVGFRLTVRMPQRLCVPPPPPFELQVAERMLDAADLAKPGLFNPSRPYYPLALHREAFALISERATESL